MKSKTNLRIIQLLLITILCLQVYSWTLNTSITYNKYETFLHLKEYKIKRSNELIFLKKKVLENIEIIKNNNLIKHKAANALFVILPIQGVLIILMLSLSFRLKLDITVAVSKTVTNIHPTLTNID